MEQIEQRIQHFADCLTVEGINEYGLPDNMPLGSFVFIFPAEVDYCLFRAIRPLNEDDILRFLTRHNVAPVGYGFVVGHGRVAMALFNSRELIDDGT